MDRTLRGLSAGLVAGIIKNAFNLFDYYFLNITNIRFIDWAAVLVTWSRPTGTFLTIFFLIITLLWDSLLGAVFAHVIFYTSSRRIFIKSTVFSLTAWFMFKIIVNLYRVPFLSGKQSTPGGMSNVLAVLLWGISLAFILKILEKNIPNVS